MMQRKNHFWTLLLSLILVFSFACGLTAGAIDVDIGGSEGDFTGGSDDDSTTNKPSVTLVQVKFESDDTYGTLDGKTQLSLTSGSKIPSASIPNVIEVTAGSFLGWVIKGEESKGIVDLETYRVTKDIVLVAVYDQNVTPDDSVEDEEDAAEAASEGLLNKADHIAYMQGDDNNNFRPSDSLTRAEACTVFYNLLLDKDVKITKSFTDVDPDAWYGTPVLTLASLGILNGYEDGTFLPNEPISRAEFVAIASRFEEVEPGVLKFPDVPEDNWAYDSIASAVAKGWISGLPDGTFGLNMQIDRASVTRIVNAMLDRTPDEDYIDTHDVRTFDDLNKTNWVYYEIMEATNAHDYVADGDGETWVALAD